MTVRMISNREGGLVRGTGAGGTNGLADASMVIPSEDDHLEGDLFIPIYALKYPQFHGCGDLVFTGQTPIVQHSNCGDSPPCFPDFPPG
jgi:hypothetical protein